jgi:hypothetical protein
MALMEKMDSLAHQVLRENQAEMVQVLLRSHLLETKGHAPLVAQDLLTVQEILHTHVTVQLDRLVQQVRLDLKDLLDPLVQQVRLDLKDLQELAVEAEAAH